MKAADKMSATSTTQFAAFTFVPPTSDVLRHRAGTLVSFRIGFPEAGGIDLSLFRRSLWLRRFHGCVACASSAGSAICYIR